MDASDSGTGGYVTENQIFLETFKIKVEQEEEEETKLEPPQFCITYDSDQEESNPPDVESNMESNVESNTQDGLTSELIIKSEPPEWIDLEKNIQNCTEDIPEDTNSTSGDGNTSGNLKVAYYMCTVCKCKMTCRDSMQKHIRWHKVDNMIKKIENSKAPDILRCKKSSASEKLNKCVQCNKDFQSVGNLNRHIKQVHDAVRFHCSDCSKSFTNDKALEIHAKIHCERPYQCDICFLSFKTRKNLHGHKIIHSDVKPFHCEQCGMDFRTKSNLNLHVQRHANVRPHQCEECNKTFQLKSNLHIHLKSHSDVRSFDCPQCGKMFKTRNSVLAHLSVHTVDLNFRCEICNKMFKSKQILSKHIKSHSNVKPFHCELCSKGFKSKSYLSKHMFLHAEAAGV